MKAQINLISLWGDSFTELGYNLRQLSSTGLKYMYHFVETQVHFSVVDVDVLSFSGFVVFTKVETEQECGTPWLFNN